MSLCVVSLYLNKKSKKNVRGIYKARAELMLKSILWLEWGHNISKARHTKSALQQAIKDILDQTGNDYGLGRV